MDKSKYELLTTNELLFTIIGGVVGAGILSLPNTMATIAKQDGWIAITIGSAYPFYVILISSIIIKNYPNNNIMDVSKIYLGNFFGNLLNFIFMAQFLLYLIAVLSAAEKVLRIYAVWFMSPFKITLVFVILIIYASTKGIKTIAKLSVLMFLLILILIFSSFMAIKDGSILNIQPLFGTGWTKIVKASFESFFSYGNIEILLVLYPYVKDKKKIFKTSLLATAIITVVYTWIVFVTIIYLGPDIVPKSLWPFFFLSESIKIPIITSFKFVSMALWILVIFKTATIQYYAATTILNNILKKLDINYICIFLSPLILIFPLLFENEIIRRDFISKTLPWVTLFNITYITLIAILSAFKKNKVQRTQDERK